ncbi:MAG: hypothetical protein NZ550_02575 [Fimbriimonadales bacterium]|nr:hypothetical protein [Fimbriimonadales bacterium]MDW8052363.1 hypothetical protein [Armatimonadota bacterium]
MRWMVILSLLGTIVPYAIAREVVVIKPTANLNTPNSAYLEFDYYRFISPSESYLAKAVYVQIRSSARFDFGVDWVHIDGGAIQTAWNLRYVVLPETEQAPGVALGMFEMADGVPPTLYLVGTRTQSQDSLHAGVYLRQGQVGWGIAHQQRTRPNLEVAIEYYRQPGGDGLLSLCLTQPVQARVSLSVYATANDRTRRLEVIGASVAFNL